MAQITKRLCIPVGSYTKDGADKPTVEYREIGHAIEFQNDNGDAWLELRIPFDALNPVLAGMAMRQGKKGESSARVKLFDVQRKKKTADPSEPPASGGPAEDDDISF